jgi:UDP-glucose 4-epimerase
MSILVLGGTGFIGKNLVARLLKNGEEVKVFSRAPKAVLGGARLIEDKKLELIAGDLATFTGWESVLDGVREVFHLAGSATPQVSDADPAYDIGSTLLGTVSFLQHSSRYRAFRLIFCSSGGTVYGVNEGKVSEGAPTNPIGAYGIVKLTIEKYLELFKHRDNLDYVVLRPSNVYGPWQDPSKGQGIIGIFLERILEGLPIRVYGDGENVRDYLFIEDLISALLKAASYRGEETVFNVGSGRGYSINEVISSIEDLTQKKADIHSLPARPFDARHNVLNIERAARLLNWKPQNSLKEGLLKTHEWLVENRDSRYSIGI